MAKQIRCNKCRAKINVPDGWTRPRARCPRCAANLAVPTATASGDSLETAPAQARGRSRLAAIATIVGLIAMSSMALFAWQKRSPSVSGITREVVASGGANEPAVAPTEDNPTAIAPHNATRASHPPAVAPSENNLSRQRIEQKTQPPTWQPFQRRRQPEGQPAPGQYIASTGQKWGVLKGTKRIMSAVFSPDNQLVATIEVGNVVRLWDLAAKKERRILPVRGIRPAFNQNGTNLLLEYTGGNLAKCEITVWDVVADRERIRLNDPELVDGPKSLVFSRDGHLLAGVWLNNEHEEIQLWNLDTGKRIATVKADAEAASALMPGTVERITVCALSPDGATLVAGGNAGTLWTWDVATLSPKSKQKWLKGMVSAITFAPDGRTLATLSADGIWFWKSGEWPNRLGQISPDGRIEDIRFRGDGRLEVFAHAATSVQLSRWDVATGQRVQLVEVNNRPIGFAACAPLDSCAPDGTMFLNSSGDDIGLWRTAGLNEITVQTTPRLTIPLETTTVFLSFTPDGSSIVAGGFRDPNLRPNFGRAGVWDAKTGTLRAQLQRRLPVHCAAVPPAGGPLALAASDSSGGELVLWDLASSQSKSFPVLSEPKFAAYSPDGKTLAASSSASTSLIDVATSQVRTNLQSAPAPVLFSPDIGLLATGDGKLFDLKTNQSRQLPDGGPPIAFLAGGKLLSRRGTTIILSNTRTGVTRATAISPGHEVFAAVVTHDGKLLALGGMRARPNQDGVISLWDVATETPRGTFTANSIGGGFRNAAVLSLAFSPDGKSLASGSVNGIKMWDVGQLLGGRVDR